jgi:8-oxo-dGTP pyrophosphatase MutT (NUDIX family)
MSHPAQPLSEKPVRVGAAITRLLHTYWRFSRGMTLGVRAAVIDRNWVFLVRHTYVPGWHFPGGGIETGETALDALTRELREEAGIELAGAPILAGFYFNRSTSPRDHVVLYVVRDFRVVTEKQPDREIAEARFFPLDNLPAGTSPATRRRLEEIERRCAPEPFW